MEEGFNLIRRRTSDLMKGAQQNMPQMPQIPQMPRLPTLPQMPALPSFASNGNEPTMKGTWERLDLPSLPRASHSLDIISGNAYIFGGEIRPSEAAKNDMHVVALPLTAGSGADCFKITAKGAYLDVPSAETAPTNATGATEYKSKGQELEEVSIEGDVESADKGKGPATDAGSSTPKTPAAPAPVPEARVGHATAVIGSRIFVFGGRGGADMKPLDEGGRVWVFDTRTHVWLHLDPVPAVKGGSIVPHPPPRSEHCATAADRPRDFAKPPPKQPRNWRERLVGDTSRTGIPQDPIVGNVAEDAVDEEDIGYGTFFVHGGILASGDRTNDLWAFDVRSKTWIELPAAPGVARSGSAITISKSRLFRFGGFDGERELGGQLDFLNLEVEMFDDRITRGEIGLRSRGVWQSILQNNPVASSNDIPVEPAQPWPAPRSVASFHALTIGGGSEYLVVAMGERTPGTDGQEGASQLLGDVWTFQVPPLGMTPASVTSALWQAMGRKTGEGKWIRVSTSPYDDEADDIEDEPQARAGLASAVMGDVEEGAVLFWGGLASGNRRLGDGWILRLG